MCQPPPHKPSSTGIFPDWHRIRSEGIDREGLLLCLTVLVWFVCGCFVSIQDDSWWHLRTGEIIWNNWTVPHFDVFSFALGPNSAWPNHEWLFQVLFYLTYAAGGFPLVNVCCGIILGITAAFLAAAMKGPLRYRSACLLAILPWVYTAFSVRPQIVGLLCFSAALFLLRKTRYSLLPVLLIIWAQFHASVVVGGILLACACACSYFFQRSHFKNLALATLMGAIAVTLSPLGLKIYTFPFESVSKLKSLSLFEWQSPGFTAPLDLYFWCCAFVLLVLMAFNRAKLRTWPALPFAILTVALFFPAARYLRSIYVWIVSAGVSVTYFLPDKPSQVPLRPSLKYLLSAVLIFLCVSALLTCWLIRSPASLGWFPVSKSGLVAIQNSAQPRYNSYNTGGFLIWFHPEEKIFIDSRQDPYPIALLHRAIEAQRSGDFKSLFDEYHFRSAIVESSMPLAAALRSAGWKTTYSGAAFEVFTKPE